MVSRVNISVDEDVLDVVDREAEKARRTRSNMIEVMILEWVADRREEERDNEANS